MGQPTLSDTPPLTSQIVPPTGDKVSRPMSPGGHSHPHHCINKQPSKKNNDNSELNVSISAHPSAAAQTIQMISLPED